MTGGADPRGLERIYVLTRGRAGSDPRLRLDLVTLIVARSAGHPGLFPEHRAILRLSRFPLSAAEISAHLRLPFSAAAVLIGDLLTAGLVEDRSPARVRVPDVDLLREVIRGLERL